MGKKGSRSGWAKGEAKKASAEYQIRGESLAALGFDSYRKYLASPLWAKIRRRAFALNGATCRGCGNAAGQIHHGDYSLPTLRGDSVASLYPACYICHKRAEFSGAKKVSPSTATARLIASGKRKKRGRTRRKKRTGGPPVPLGLLLAAIDALDQALGPVDGETPLEAIEAELVAVFEARRRVR